MRKVSMTVKVIVESLIAEATNKGKHVLKVETIRERAERHIGTGCEDEDHEVLYSIGLNQLIYQWLNAFGFYSVRIGLFVNPDACNNVHYLEAIINNAENSIDGRIKAMERLKAKRDPQISMKFEDDDMVSYDVPMTEEEFVDHLLADAV